MITEFTFALERGLKMMDIANAMHVYPTYSMGNMRIAAQSSTDQVMNSFTGTVLKKLAGG